MLCFSAATFPLPLCFCPLFFLNIYRARLNRLMIYFPHTHTPPPLASNAQQGSARPTTQLHAHPTPPRPKLHIAAALLSVHPRSTQAVTGAHSQKKRTRAKLQQKKQKNDKELRDVGTSAAIGFLPPSKGGRREQPNPARAARSRATGGTSSEENTSSSMGGEQNGQRRQNGGGRGKKKITPGQPSVAGC